MYSLYVYFMPSPPTCAVWTELCAVAWCFSAVCYCTYDTAGLSISAGLLKSERMCVRYGCPGLVQLNTVQQLLLALCPVKFIMVLTPPSFFRTRSRKHFCCLLWVPTHGRARLLSNSKEAMGLLLNQMPCAWSVSRCSSQTVIKYNDFTVQ